jgi:hypothetical protein
MTRGLRGVYGIICIIIFGSLLFAAREVVTEAVFFRNFIKSDGQKVNNLVLVKDGENNTIITDEINIFYEGKSIYVGEIICKNNRLFIPLNSFVPAAGGSFLQDGDEISIFLKQEINFNLVEGSDNMSFAPFISEQNYYVSFFDMCECLNLFSDWNDATKTISLFNDDKYYKSEGLHGKTGSKRNTLIRLEDIAPVQKDSYSEDDLIKQRIIADFLYSKGIPFSIALTPRYVNPEEEIDNDPSEEYSFYNAQFVYTLDHYRGRGGIIGLHGYTHQNGKGKSLFDKEFGDEVNRTIKETEERLEKGIKALNILGFEPGFFFFPHYVATQGELLIAAKKFDIIYQTERDNSFVKRYFMHRTKFIPTPLQYIDCSENEDKFIQNIRDLDSEKLMSMFFHPFLEYKYIEVVREGLDKPRIIYPQGSILHRIVAAVEETRGNFTSIHEIE